MLKSYIRHEEAGEIFIDDLTGLDLDQVLFRAAKQYAFSELSEQKLVEWDRRKEGNNDAIHAGGTGRDGGSGCRN